MQKFQGLKARLVWDGSDTVLIPPEMGEPRSDQMQGTAAERLTELCGRVCYDSLGVGRSSADYFDHILGVGHLSIAEHFNATVEVKGNFGSAHIMALTNRPWVWVTYVDAGCLRITTNVRGAREWDAWSAKQAKLMPWFPTDAAKALGYALRDSFHNLAPRIVAAPNRDEVWPAMKMAGLEGFRVVPPANNAERWISVYMVGSRGFSHEQVRHGDFTAISQRSTRYCEESDSPWVIHPLVQEYCQDPNVPETDRRMAAQMNDEVIAKARHTYRWWVGKLVDYVMPRMAGDPYAKTSARKQARGAARGFLGNALETEVIFSGTVFQWLHLLRMRAANAADAEIRAVSCETLPLLKDSRYGQEFADLTLAPASDGIGRSLLDGGAK